MKTFKQFLNERASISQGIHGYLKRRGYVKLGKGEDQVAYLEPSGYVLKIFGTDKSGNFSKGQMMFKVWEEYCSKNKNNQFLPKIIGYESFEYDMHKYLQIRMEKLKKLDNNLAESIEDIAGLAVTKNIEKRNEHFQNINKMLETNVIPEHLKILLNKNIAITLNKLIQKIGKDNFDKLWNTMVDTSDLGRKHGFLIDMHRDNFMSRDGIPVLIDPWVAEE